MYIWHQINWSWRLFTDLKISVCYFKKCMWEIINQKVERIMGSVLIRFPQCLIYNKQKLLRFYERFNFIRGGEPENCDPPLLGCYWWGITFSPLKLTKYEFNIPRNVLQIIIRENWYPVKCELFQPLVLSTRNN